jgi:hypothetical protein
MKDTIDPQPLFACSPAFRRGRFLVAIATPVDPILTAIERDRLAHVAFVTSVNRTNEGKTAQEARDATQTPTFFLVEWLLAPQGPLGVRNEMRRLSAASNLIHKVEQDQRLTW